MHNIVKWEITPTTTATATVTSRNKSFSEQDNGCVHALVLLFVINYKNQILRSLKNLDHGRRYSNFILNVTLFHSEIAG